MIRQNLKNKINSTKQDLPDLFISKDKISTALGNSESYLVDVLDFTKGDLLRMERAGLAIRGRAPFKSGHVIRWILLDVTNGM